MVRAFTGCVPSLVCPPARGLPCERFTAVLTDRTSCITRGRGGWLDLPRGGLAPPILCQLSWRTRLWVRLGRADRPAGARIRDRCSSLSGLISVRSDRAALGHFRTLRGVKGGVLFGKRGRSGAAGSDV